MKKGQNSHIIRNSITKDFTKIPNSLINDDRISDRAKFLYIYIASKPPNWTFKNKQLTRSLRYTADTLRKYIKELMDFGWLSKEKQKRVNGKFTPNIYHLSVEPIGKIPYQKNTDTENTETEKNRGIKKQKHSKIDYNNTDFRNNNNFKHFLQKSTRGRPIT